MPNVSLHFRRILVPVDFSRASDALAESGMAVKVGTQFLDFAPASMRSVRMAAALARAGSSELLLVHATPPLNYSVMYTGPAGVSLPSGIVAEIHKNAADTSVAALETLAKQYCEGVPVSYAARPGVAVNIVLEETERFNADLVVMAASGRTRVTRFFVGSTADRIIRLAGCPVLVVPAHPRE
jgi:nucleotide-binding universal stress UspA family protein